MLLSRINVWKRQLVHEYYCSNSKRRWSLNCTKCCMVKPIVQSAPSSDSHWHYFMLLVVPEMGNTCAQGERNFWENKGMVFACLTVAGWHEFSPIKFSSRWLSGRMILKEKQGMKKKCVKTHSWKQSFLATDMKDREAVGLAVYIVSHFIQWWLSALLKGKAYHCTCHQES